jgi:aminopeptidase N
MRADLPPTILLKNYLPTPYLIDKVQLTFALHETSTRVSSQIYFKPNTKSKQRKAALELDGEMITLVSLAIDGVTVAKSDYQVKAAKLIVTNVPQKPFVLSVETTCAPKENTALSGLYMSSGMYCTQCEAEGFRRITYFYDRPDVMAKFQVRIEAPKSLPVLLSNGNPSAHGAISKADRHFAEWNDPHPKPSYLFALVAGDLAHVKSSFRTSEGRKVALGIYVEKGKEDRCAWAMEATKASMRWDEKVFGRAYDLDVFNIVAVSDFNMGAMENKGLNIFNDKYILAKPDTATDTDYELIEAIIAHEYFHNWTGNRITCRDWFQLCLKEGLTVFRDQEFTSDHRSRSVKRIDDVQDLRSRQFPEDRGPLQHPPRPDQYMEINNFYTSTVYEKGAELCRMMKTLIGDKAFAKAMALYFKRHDGEAATVEDFVQCMADASKRNLAQFFRWYTQAGTPTVTVRGTYFPKRKTYEISVSQKTPRLKGQKPKQPLHMPLLFGLVGPDGRDLKVKSSLLEVTKTTQVFKIANVSAAPVLSINRGFSAPIILKQNITQAELLFLMAHDSDSFNRWEAAQSLGKALIAKTYAALKAKKTLPNVEKFAAALSVTLQDVKLDDAFKAQMLQLPFFEEMVAVLSKDVDADMLFAAREYVRRNIAIKMLGVLEATYHAMQTNAAYRPDAAQAGKRALRFSCLGLASAADEAWAAKEAHDAFEGADNMTVEFSALSIGARLQHGDDLLKAFYKRHADDHLLVDKWFAVQALMPRENASDHIRALMKHSAFTLKTPNRVYALLRSFVGGNLTGFHAADGSGYRLGADVILALDTINPQVGSRIATAFRSWRMFDVKRRSHAQKEMQRILKTKNLSRDVFEIISRTLKAF